MIKFVVLIPSLTEKEILSQFLPSSTPIFTTGVGLISPFIQLQQLPLEFQNATFILCGIAGGTQDLELGKAYEVVQSKLIEIGTETSVGNFLSISDLNFDPKGDYSPIISTPQTNLENITDITVPNCTGTSQTLLNRYHNTIKTCETMESFSVLSALKSHEKTIHIRGISNYIGERKIQEWNITGALESCASAIKSIIK